MQIQLVGVEAPAEGGKGLFDFAAPARVATTDLAEVSASVRTFCQAFLAGLAPLEAHISRFALQTIEVNIELTLKGEVRLIAAASAETKGAIKLTFGTGERP